MEGSGERLDGPNGLLTRLVGPGRGLELVSNVNGIPKGSRLAVSTNLLASLITCCMRATGQAGTLTGQLTEPERRLVAARAIMCSGFTPPSCLSCSPRVRACTG